MRPDRGRVVRAGFVAAAIASTGLVSGCGSSDITVGRVQTAIAATFANLFVDQQTLLGRPDFTRSQITAAAHCSQGGSTTHVGPGDDWVCLLHWRSFGGRAAKAAYDVQVQVDGCFAAVGPSDVVGDTTVTTPTGRSVINPIYQFDGCFGT